MALLRPPNYKELQWTEESEYHWQISPRMPICCSSPSQIVTVCLGLNLETEIMKQSCAFSKCNNLNLSVVLYYSY
jgi:hypothetical protein